MSDDEIYEAILRLAAAIHLTPPRWVSVRTRTPMPEDATPAALSSAVRVHALSLDRTPAQWLLLQETPTPELDLDDDDDRYSALPWEHIGGGGGGDLYRVFDRRLERTVVLKLLKKDKFDRKSFERFRQEATAAGRLNHQSIVPIFDTGSHHGRPFFTMQEVEGTTLAALLDGPRPPGVEQLVGHLCDVCNAIGHAHVRGYVHRDLKPSNIMITHANQVVIVDWGLVKRLGRNHTQPPGRVEPVSSPLTLEGMVLGTPAYMAPEQARTEDDRVGTASDVYALGAMLREIATGEMPYAGLQSDAIIAKVSVQPVQPLSDLAPARLRVNDAQFAAICDRAMAFEPADRYPDAYALGRALETWRERQQRLALAREIIAEADAMRASIDLARAEAARMRAEAARLLNDVAQSAPIEEKREGWAHEEAAAQADQLAERRGVDYVQTLRSALRYDPDLAEAHARLARFYRELHQTAEERGNTADALRFEALLQRHDRGEFATYLGRIGELALRTSPANARVAFRALTSVDRRLSLGPSQPLGRTPLAGVAVPAGCNVIELSANGRRTTRMEIVVPRAGVFDGIAPGEATARPIALPPANWPVEDRYVPCGWCLVGEGRGSSQRLDARRIWIDGFVIRRDPTTFGEYLAFLLDLQARGRGQEAEKWQPRSIARTESALFGRDAQGAFTLGAAPSAQHPVTDVSWFAARAYCQWLTERTGQPWRLPHELEVEKAARGVAGRRYPWGDIFEATYAHTVERQVGVNATCPVGGPPADESVYGVRGLAGNVRDWCINVYQRHGDCADGERLRLRDDRETSGQRCVRGGAFVNVGELNEPVVRFAAQPDRGFSTVSFRPARSWPEP